MKSLGIMILTMLLIGCTSAPTYRESPLQDRQPFTSSSPYPRLKAQLDALLPDTLFPPAGIGIKIRSLKTGETLYEANPDILFNPASNEKLFTSAGALAVLGSEYHFVTSFAFDTMATPRIYIRGGGDPLLATPDIDTIAATLARLLPGGKKWTLAGDVSLFDDVPWGRGWMWDDEPDRTGMQITPLSVNGNTLRVSVRPAAAVSEPVLVSTEPPNTYASIENSGRTVSGDSAKTLGIERRWRERTNTVVISGNLPLNDTLVSVQLSVWQPEWYVLSLLKDRLEERGIACLGAVLDTLPSTSVPVGRIEHRLDSAVAFMNKTSDNLSAENLLKLLGAVTRGTPGTADSGIATLSAFLASRGIDTSNMVIADGSGVSRYNLTSAASIVRLLTVMHDDPDHFDIYYKSLSVAGIDGRLSRRMRGTSAEGNLHAKDGTLRGVTTLSGYVTTSDGELLAFSILMQHFNRGLAAYRQVQDRIGIFLSGVSRNTF